MCSSDLKTNQVLYYTNAKQKYRDRAMEEKERVALFLCQAEREHSRLVPQELCPPHWGIGRGYTVWGSGQRYVVRIKAATSLAFFFLLHSFKRVGLLTGLACVQGLWWSPNLDELLWSL